MNQILIKFKVYSHFSHEVVLGYKCKSGVMFPSSVLLSFFPLLYKTLPEEMPDCFGVGAYKTCADVFLEGSVMSELFRHIRTHLVLSAVLTLLLGIVLTVMPGIAAETLVSVLGWLLVITGIASILSSLLTHSKPVGQGDLVLGLLELATGLVLLVRPGLMMSICGIVLGLLLVLHGVRDIQSARESKALGYDWKLPMLVGILKLVMGALVIINPFSTAALLLRVAGICLIVDGVGDLLLVWRSPRI